MTWHSRVLVGVFFCSFVLVRIIIRQQFWRCSIASERFENALPWMLSGSHGSQMTWILMVCLFQQIIQHHESWKTCVLQFMFVCSARKTHPDSHIFGKAHCGLGKIWLSDCVPRLRKTTKKNMYIYIYTYMYVYIYIHICMYIYIYVYINDIPRYWLDEYTVRKSFPMFIIHHVCHDVWTLPLSFDSIRISQVHGLEPPHWDTAPGGVVTWFPPNGEDPQLALLPYEVVRDDDHDKSRHF